MVSYSKKLLLPGCIFITVFTSNAQNVVLETTYHSKTHKKVSQSRASLVKQVIQLPDGTIQFETSTYPQLKLVEQFTYKDSVPIGKWISYDMVLDYDFALNYTREDCGNHIGYNVITKRESVMLVSDSLSLPNIQLIGYEIAREIRYPNLAKREHTNGVVVLRFFIDADGKIEDVSVYKSSGSALLDKEAVRAIRQLKKRTKAFIFNGEPVRGCILFPIKFIS